MTKTRKLTRAEVAANASMERAQDRVIPEMVRSAPPATGWYIIYDPETMVIWGVGASKEACHSDACHWQSQSNVWTVLMRTEGTAYLVQQVLAHGSMSVRWKLERGVAMTDREIKDVRQRSKDAIIRKDRARRAAEVRNQQLREVYAQQRQGADDAKKARAKSKRTQRLVKFQEAA